MKWVNKGTRSVLGEMRAITDLLVNNFNVIKPEIQRKRLAVFVYVHERSDS